MKSMCLMMLGLVTAGVAATCAAPVAAQSDSPCVTKSECDARADAQAMRERRAAWEANVARENDFHADMAALRAQSRADAANKMKSSAQEIMRRRREAAAQASGN